MSCLINNFFLRVTLFYSLQIYLIAYFIKVLRVHLCLIHITLCPPMTYCQDRWHSLSEVALFGLYLSFIPFHSFNLSHQHS
jgi:hypothetical protein